MADRVAGNPQYEAVLNVLRSVRCDDADCGKSPNMHFAEALIEAGLIVEAEPRGCWSCLGDSEGCAVCGGTGEAKS